MKQDDRFFSITGVFALLVTVSAFLWIHQEAIFRTGLGARAAHRVDAAVPIRTAAVPTPISPTAEHASRTALATPVARSTRPPAIIPAAYEREAAGGAGQWATDIESIQRLFDTVASIASGATPGLERDPLPLPAEVLVSRDRDDRLVVAPGTHRRYQGLIESFGGFETAAFAAALDLFDSNWTERMTEGGDFRSTLAAAIDHLLEVELPDVEPDMISRGTHWGFVDPDYDRLTAVQKHILLMGRTNARVVRSRLEEMRDLLGEPEPQFKRLPEPFSDDELLIAEDETAIESSAIAAPK